MADLPIAADGSAQPVTINDPIITTNVTSVRSDGSLLVLPSHIGFIKENRGYSVFLDVSAATSGTDNPLILLRNPNGSGKVIYVGFISGNTTVTNVSAEFKVFANPTVTVNGTAQTAISRNVGNSAPVASGLVTTLPTVTSNGSTICGSVTGQNSADVTIIDDFSVAIQPNNSILITASPSSNNRNMGIELMWVEI